MENDLQQSKADIAKMHAKIGALEQRHEQELMILAQAHDAYKSQMESEQSQLIQIAQESQKQVQQMAANMGKPRSGTVVTPMPVFDDDYNSNNTTLRGDGTTLDAEFNQYPYSEDEWLDDSDELQQQTPLPQLDAVILDSNSINIEPVKQPTPPPFDAEFAMVKESAGKSPIDPTKSFKMQKDKHTLELADPTKNFSNEKKSYNVDTVDVTTQFSMEKQSTTNDEKEKDATVEFESVKNSVSVESKDPTTMWRMEKSSVEVEKIDPETSFVSEKQEFGVEPSDPTKHFSQQSQSYDLERADISNTFVTQKQKEIRQESKELEDMVYEKQSIQHDRESLELEFSQTALSHTPKTSDADKRGAGFSSAKMSIDQPKEVPKKKPQYAFQVRHLRMDVDAVPQRITRIRKPPPAPHDRPNYGKFYDGKDEIIRKSLAFQKIMSKWKKDEQEKGGKPEILVQREYELVNRWNNDEKKRTSIKTRIPVNRQSKYVSPTSPSSDIFQSITHGAAQRVTKARHHKLKPKLRGFITIIRSHFVPKYQLKREQKFFFCLDGLPSTTNIDKNESDKSRKNDFLVPVLFFFDKEEDFKRLAKEAGALAVRNAIFQKAFARLAKGIITLHTHSVDSSLELAISKLEIMKGRPITKIDKSQDTKGFTGNSLYIVNEADFHRFEFDDPETRNDWLHKINKLIMKRTKSVAMASETYTRSHKESLGFGTPIQRASRASSRVAEIKTVENSFD